MDSHLTDEYLAAIEAESLGAPNGAATNGAHGHLRIVPADAGLPQAVCALTAPPPEPIRWLVEGFWPAGEIGLLVGDGGAFKSSAALHMAAAIAGGYRVFDQYETARRPVLIVSAEDPMGVVQMRLDAFIAGHGWNRARVLENVHILADGDPTLGEPRWRRHLWEEVKRIQPGMLLLDPWAELVGGDENSNSEARPAIKYLRHLTRAHDCAVSIVHHAGKAGPDKRALDRIRGASALPSAARVILFFEYQPQGVAVENLKMSRTARLEPFVVTREIAHAPENRAQWTSARLGYETRRQHARTKGESFVLVQLRAVHPKRLSSGELRRLAVKGTGVNNEDIAAALVTLPAAGLIDWEVGERKAKMWGLTPRSLGAPSTGHEAAESSPEDWSTADESADDDPRTDTEPPCPDSRGQGRKSLGAHPAHTLPGQVSDDPAHPAPPLRGGGQGGQVTRPGQGRGQPNGGAELDDEEADILAEIDERAGLMDEPPLEEGSSDA